MATLAAVLSHAPGFKDAGSAVQVDVFAVRSLTAHSDSTICIGFDSGFAVWDRGSSDVWTRREMQCQNSRAQDAIASHTHELRNSYSLPLPSGRAAFFTAIGLSPCTRRVVCGCETLPDRAPALAIPNIAAHQDMDESVATLTPAGSDAANGSSSGRPNKRTAPVIGEESLSVRRSSRAKTKHASGSSSSASTAGGAAAAALSAGRSDSFALQTLVTLEFFDSCGHHRSSLEYASGARITALACLDPDALLVGDKAGVLSLWKVAREWTDCVDETPVWPVGTAAASLAAAWGEVIAVGRVAALSDVSGVSSSSPSSSSHSSPSCSKNVVATFAHGQMLILGDDSLRPICVIDRNAAPRILADQRFASSACLSIQNSILILCAAHSHKHVLALPTQTGAACMPQWRAVCFGATQHEAAASSSAAAASSHGGARSSSSRSSRSASLAHEYQYMDADFSAEKSNGAASAFAAPRRSVLSGLTADQIIDPLPLALVQLASASLTSAAQSQGAMAVVAMPTCLAMRPLLAAACDPPARVTAVCAGATTRDGGLFAVAWESGAVRLFDAVTGDDCLQLQLPTFDHGATAPAGSASQRKAQFATSMQFCCGERSSAACIRLLIATARGFVFVYNIDLSAIK